MVSSTSLEQGQNLPPHSLPLVPHTSSLPDFLYILSFAPPCPSPIRSPRKFITHPVVLFALGIPCAIVAGVAFPAWDIVLGHWTNRIRAVDATSQSITNAGSFAGWLMTIVGVVFILSFTGMLVCFSMAGTKLSNLVREQYLAAIVVQDQAFFDRIGPGEIVSRASKDINSIRTGLGERLGYLIWSFALILGCFISAFIAAPRVAGVLFALIPFTIGIFTGLGWWTERASRTVDVLDGRASSLIEQILSSVRISQSFDMGGRLLLKLENDMLRPLRKLSTRKSAVKALELAAAYGAGFLVYSATFWYGGIAIGDGASIGGVLTAFYNYVNIFFGFAGVVPHLLATTQALHAISSLRLQIERRPPIDVRDPAGVRYSDSGEWQPSFELDGVTFAYPSRPTQKALDNISLHIQPGRFTALVGPSGSGKSTLASLLLRLYDPITASQLTETDRKVIKNFQVDGNDAAIDADVLAEEEKRVVGSGVIRFAGQDIRDYNVKWLRSQVAVVLQNPQLVSGTVFDNVAIGLTGTDFEYRADLDGVPGGDVKDKGKLALIMERVEEALMKAQAWEFVQDLPDGIHTKVAGGRTGVLSGGQVQRVALARALVRRPRCLLLDEATSAVSADTELKIQQSLIEEQKERGMTLIVSAHRLSTIVSADRIYVMVAGRARRYGTYDELMSPECPDQTFRNMALVKQPDHVVKAPPRSMPSSARTISNAPVSSDKIPAVKPEDRTKPVPPPMKSVKEAFRHNFSPLTMGIACGVIGGGAWVVAAWLYGRGVADFGIPDISSMRAAVNRWSLWFLILTIGTFVVIGLHGFGLELSGERIVSEYRRESVRALMKQDIAYFEGEATGSGSLTAAAATHPQNVGNVIGLILGQVISSFTNFLGVVILGFSLNWRLAVMILPALAVATGFGWVNFKCQTIFEKGINDDVDKQSDFVAEAANSIQLLSALTREAETVRQFNMRFTSKPIRSKWLIGTGASMGVSTGVLHFFGGLIMWYGSLLVARGQTSIADLFTVIEAVIVAVYITARVWTYTGDFARMNTSLKKMQGWLDREPELAFLTPSTPSTQKTAVQGIEFKDVSLRYPSRPDVMALNNVSFRMDPGRSYAFCGTSGAGKSSILAVLQRFYDISAGSVMLDGQDIREMEPRVLRREMGYVSQEPILFEETVRWNLVSGATDPDSVTQGQLEWACQQACILDFIQSLPEGFDTDLGLKGGQLSGGQRQRLCIARALIRQPRILLLDEATSALDGKSEAHVQEALDNASRGRLTITIAHRLSTIRKADTIFVMDQGQIVEIGTHEELVVLNGRYYELVQAQL